MLTRRTLTAAGVVLAAAVLAPPGMANLNTDIAGRPALDLRATAAPRVVEKLGGFLTAPSTAPAADIARGYLAQHVTSFAATAADVSGLVQTRDYVDVGGTQHVSFAQAPDGIPIFQGGVQVNVTGDGRVVSVLGAPLHVPPALDATP